MSKQFFNMIAGRDNSACILLYGNIGGWDDGIQSGDIVRELLEMENEYDHIDVRINSMGGEVYAGLAIFNAFRQSQADIRIYVDGVAASMGSVIASSRRPVYMSKYARMMLHSVTGGAYGNKDELKELAEHLLSLEDTLADIYAARSGQTKETIKARFFDGKDHWLTAGEALAMGLVDGIYDTDPIPENYTPEQVYATYQNRLQSTKHMLTDLLRKRPSFATLANDEAMLRHIEHLETEAGKVLGLSNEVTQLTGRLQVYEQAEKDARAAEIASLVDAAKKDGQLNESQAPDWAALLTLDFEHGKAALAALTPAKRIVDDLGQPVTGGSGAWEQRMEAIRNNLKK